MSKTSKLCQVVYHASRLDGTKVFLCYFVVTVDQKATTTKEATASYEKDISNK